MYRKSMVEGGDGRAYKAYVKMAFRSLTDSASVDKIKRSVIFTRKGLTKESASKRLAYFAKQADMCYNQIIRAYSPTKMDGRMYEDVF